MKMGKKSSLGMREVERIKVVTEVCSDGMRKGVIIKRFKSYSQSSLHGDVYRQQLQKYV
jgi:hypothetical protein